jgi:hypothetical protein
MATSGAKRSRPPSAPLLPFEVDPRNVRYVLECGPKAEWDRRAARGGVIVPEFARPRADVVLFKGEDEEDADTTATRSDSSTEIP